VNSHDIGRLRGGAAQDRLDASQELAGAERLDDVVVRAQLQSLHTILFRPASSEQNHRSGGVALADLAQDIQPVTAREEDVEQNQVHVRLGCCDQPRMSVGGFCHVVTGDPQGVGDPAADRRLILHHDDAGLAHHDSVPG